MLRSRLIAPLVWFVGLLAVGMQALSLATRYFQPWLSADYIYPQLFAEDVLSGRYPLSGWTLSSAPYFFPDMGVAMLLRALGGSGTVLPGYVVFFYLTLAVVAGWSLQRATSTGWTAWLGGVALANLLLLWQSVGDHAQFLWQLGTVGFHGGVILLGLASFALWSGLPESTLSRRRRLVAFAVLFLGSISDTLFLTQAVLPLGVGIWAQAGWGRWSPRLKDYVMTLLAALGLVLMVRGALFFGGWFNFSKVVRYAPLPAAVHQATMGFIRDVSQTIAPQAWGLLVLAALSLGLVLVFWWRNRGQQRPLIITVKPATGMVIVGLLATTLLPLAAAYWKDASHVRYLLPWLVWPGWLALVWLLPKISGWGCNVRGLTVSVLFFGGVSWFSLPPIRVPALRWPYTAQQSQLDDFLVSRDLRYGLSDYWRAHEINTLTHAPVHLFALRPTARVSFWNNNAFWFYKKEKNSGRLTVPDYTFIITDGLDETALRQRFGEPSEQKIAGGFTIWIYAASAAHDLTQEIQKEVRAFVQQRPGEELIGQY